MGNNLGMACGPKGLDDSALGFNPISANLIKASTGRMYFVPEGQHDSSQARSAWNSANPKSRPLGYGMLRASKRTDSTWRPFPREIPLGLAAPDHTVPYGTVLSRDTFPGTSCLATIMLSVEALINLALMGWKLWAWVIQSFQGKESSQEL